LPVLPSPQAWGYRNKVQVPFGAATGKLVAGFYAAGSHEIVDFSACPVQPDLSVKIALKVKELARRFSWQPYDERQGRGWLRHLFVRTNSAGRALAALVTRTPDLPKREEFVAEMTAAFPELVGLHQNHQPERTSVILGEAWRRLWGADTIEERIGKLSFLVSPGAFLQVNTPAAEVLYEEVLKALREGGKTFELGLDLYSGVGTLALWIAPAFRRVLAIEENRDAVRDAWKNAERNGIKNVRFLTGRVEAALSRMRGDLPPACAAVVDPPRAGLSQPALRFLTSKQIRRVVYVSCNPATFARDAGYLLRSGFTLARVQPVDLFPQTSHVELVGLFDR
jgi:23S rRNA (uracil1939-C5)-methyltransferase